MKLCVPLGFSAPPFTKVAIAEVIRAGRICRRIRIETVHRKVGMLGPVVQCNVGKRGWMAGSAGVRISGYCIGCTMPGFPDKFMPFMDQPPGSLLSSNAVMTYGRAIHALRRFTQASLNKNPVGGGKRRSPTSNAADSPEVFEVGNGTRWKQGINSPTRPT